MVNNKWPVNKLALVNSNLNRGGEKKQPLFSRGKYFYILNFKIKEKKITVTME